MVAKMKTSDIKIWFICIRQSLWSTGTSKFIWI